MPVTAGGINRHLHISSNVLSNAISLDEDAISNRGYFIGLLHQAGDVEEEEADAVPGNLEDWNLEGRSGGNSCGGWACADTLCRWGAELV